MPRPSRRRVRRVRRNPAQLASRVTVTDVVLAWRALDGPLVRAASVGVLAREGWLDDEAARRAAIAKTTGPIKKVLQRVGGPLAQLALRAHYHSPAGLQALAELAPAVLPWLQEALVRAWDAIDGGRLGGAAELARILGAADLNVLTAVARAVAGSVVKLTSASDKAVAARVLGLVDVARRDPAAREVLAAVSSELAFDMFVREGQERQSLDVAVLWAAVRAADVVLATSLGAAAGAAQEVFSRATMAQALSEMPGGYGRGVGNDLRFQKIFVEFAARNVALAKSVAACPELLP